MAGIIQDRMIYRLAAETLAESQEAFENAVERAEQSLIAEGLIAPAKPGNPAKSFWSRFMAFFTRPRA